MSSQSVSQLFHGPAPRSPSTGSQSGSATPGLTDKYRVLAPGGYSKLSQVSCEVNLSQRTGIRVFPVAFCPSFCPLKRVGEAKTRDGPGAGPDHLPLRLRVIAVGPTLYMRQLTPPRFTRSHQTARAKGSTSAQTDVTTATHDTPIPIMHVDVHPSMHTPALSHMERTYLQPSHYACPPEELDLLHSVRTALHMHGRPRNLACLTASPQFRSLPQGTGLAFSRLRGPCVRSARRSPSPH